MTIATLPRTHDFTETHKVPYIFWDRDVTVGELRTILRDPDHPERPAMLAHLLREARPDEVWAFVSPADVAAAWSEVAPRLGRRRAFWEWLLAAWRELGFLA